MNQKRHYWAVVDPKTGDIQSTHESIWAATQADRMANGTTIGDFTNIRVWDNDRWAKGTWRTGKNKPMVRKPGLTNGQVDYL